MPTRRDVTHPAPFLDSEHVCAATFVRHVEIHDSLGSTNDRAAELARNVEIELPALVAARLQTAGRGRGHHTWWAADGALTFSLLLDQATSIGPADWPKLSLATAVAVCDALSTILCEPARASLSPAETEPSSDPVGIGGERALSIQPSEFHIKWPNDVLLGGHKVCGILIESPGGPKPVSNRLIVGIGVNVNNSWHEVPPEVRCSGTALRDVGGREFDLHDVLIVLLNSLSNRINQLCTHDGVLIRDWQRLDYLAGRSVVLECEGRRIDGRGAEIADDGALVIDTRSGRQRFYSGSVRLA